LGLSAETDGRVCGRQRIDLLGADIPLPQGVPPPVTELGSSGLTKLLISRENELGLRGSPLRGPSERRAGNQRYQRQSSDKRLHHISPCFWASFVISCNSRRADASCCVFHCEISSAPRSDSYIFG